MWVKQGPATPCATCQCRRQMGQSLTDIAFAVDGEEYSFVTTAEAVGTIVAPSWDMVENSGGSQSPRGLQPSPSALPRTCRSIPTHFHKAMPQNSTANATLGAGQRQGTQLPCSSQQPSYGRVRSQRPARTAS